MTGDYRTHGFLGAIIGLQGIQIVNAGYEFVGALIAIIGMLVGLLNLAGLYFGTSSNRQEEPA